MGTREMGRIARLLISIPESSLRIYSTSYKTRRRPNGIWEPSISRMEILFICGVTTLQPPTQGREETQAAFTLWLHAARLERSQVLANRAERQEAALKTHCESFQQPPPLPTPSEADRLEKQSLLQRLASQAVENTIDPRDQLIFAFIDNAGGDAARAAFQKVLAPENTLGLDAMTAAEKELVFRW